MIGVVHEHPRIGSDGESEEGSGTSEDPNVSPTSDEIAINNGKQVGIFFFFHLLEFSTPGWNNRDHSCEAPTKAGWGSEAVKPGMRYLYHNYSQLTNFYEQEEINKRLSLPADLKLPDNFITRQTASPTLEGPITRYESLVFLSIQ